VKDARAIALIASVAGVAAAWIAFDLLVWGYGESPRMLLAMLFDGTWGTGYGAAQVFYKATPLLFTGVAVDLALRAGLFNIGAEGQLAVGSLAAGAVGAALPPGVPAIVAVPLLLLVAAIAGAAWAAPAALLRARLGVHEVISTIMLNRIAETVVVVGLGAGLAVKGTVRTADLPPPARIPRFDALFDSVRGTAASYAVLLALACAVLLPWAFGRTRILREVALVGMNPIACAAERIPVRRRMVEAMLFSGAIAALASSATILGYKGHFEAGLGAGAGFGGIAVAMLGRGSAVGLVASALLFGTLEQGGLAINAHVPMESMQILEGVIIVAVALADARVRASFLRAPVRATTASAATRGAST
jgi:simple sugar transport system permease protein